MGRIKTKRLWNKLLWAKVSLIALSSLLAVGSKANAITQHSIDQERSIESALRQEFSPALTPTNILSNSKAPSTEEIDWSIVRNPSVDAVVAQIIPDGELGAESSVLVPEGGSSVNPAVDLIQGGAVRGSNLFHSFQEFNIEPNQRVYFSNPTGIDNILSRVTGGNFSTIDGLLGVDGSASLYFLNPNGIVFGENAELDIRGSFTASTAESFTFLDGRELEPRAVGSREFLSISVPSGVQFNTQPNGFIENLGRLSVGQDLYLSGDRLSLAGAMIAGRELDLQAQGSVLMRDTGTNLFLVQSGSDLTIRGNERIDIEVFERLDQGAIVSGGDLTLISDQPIWGETYFESAGSTRFISPSGLPASIGSFSYRPTIIAGGDVLFGDYTGTALRVEAGGSIEAGAILVTNPTLISVLDSDGSLTDESRDVILRAGVEESARSSASFGNEDVNSVGNQIEAQPLGEIIVDSINTSDLNGGRGGDVVIFATGNISITGTFDYPEIEFEPFSGLTPFASLGTLSFSDQQSAENGGTVSISSDFGSVTTGVINSSSSSFSFDSGNGGRVSILARNGDVSSDSIVTMSSSFSNGGKGGNISVNTDSGNIFVDGFLDARSFTLDSGQPRPSVESNSNNRGGGDISVSSLSGDILIEGGLATSARAGFGGSGDGGDIEISSLLGNIEIGGRVSSWAFSDEEGGSGNGGNILISSEEGALFMDVDDPNLRFYETRQFRIIDSSSESLFTSSGEGGDIIISAAAGNLRLGAVESASSSVNGTASSGGNIGISLLNGDISIRRLRSSGDLSGGNVRIRSLNGDISTGYIDASGNDVGGSVSVHSTNGNILAGNVFSNSSKDGGSIRFSSVLGNITTENLSSFVISDDTSGSGGDVSLSSFFGDISVGDVNSFFDVSSSPETNTILPEIVGNAGAVSISTQRNISGNEASVITTSGASSGSGGDVFIQGRRIDDINVVTISDSGRSGNTNIESAEMGSDIENFRVFTSGQREITLPTRLESERPEDFDFDFDLVFIPDDALALFNPNIAPTPETFTLTFGGFGESGNTSVSSSGNLVIRDSEFISDANGSVGAGDFTFSGTESIELENTQILSDSNSTGAGGNIRFFDADRLILNDTIIGTDTAGLGSAGSIFIEDIGALVLYQDSLLLSDAQGEEGGGNIDISADFVIAAPNNNSDIIANAIEGSGGRVSIESNQIFGFTQQDGLTTEQLRQNSSSDISASSQFGQQGSVALNNIEPDPAQGLSELPRNLLASTDQISEGCSANIDTSSQSEFVTTGRGGIPSRPGEALSRQNTDVPWVTLPSETAFPELSASLASLPSSSPQSLVEAQGWVTQPDGQVFFVDKSYENTDFQVSGISGTGHCSASTPSEVVH